MQAAQCDIVVFGHSSFNLQHLCSSWEGCAFSHRICLEAERACICTLTFLISIISDLLVKTALLTPHGAGGWEGVSFGSSPFLLNRPPSPSPPFPLHCDRTIAEEMQSGSPAVQTSFTIEQW